METDQIYTAATAPADSKDMLDGIAKGWGFVPNVMGVLAASPTALSCTLALLDKLGAGTFDAVEQQVVALSMSRENRCDYCVAVHTTMGQGADVPAAVLSALRDGTEVPNPRLAALSRLASEVIDTRGNPQDATVRAFLDAGYNRGQLFELLTWAALKTLTNYTNHIAHTPVDDAFAANAWSPGV